MMKYFESLGKEDAGTIIFQKGFEIPGDLKLRLLESVNSVSLSLTDRNLGVCQSCLCCDFAGCQKYVGI